MKLKNMKLKVSVLIIATLIVSLGLYTYSRNTGGQNNVAAEVNQRLSLVRPAFAQSMDPPTSFLDQEAGISIYLNTSARASAQSVERG